MSYTTKPIELPLSTEKEYVLVDVEGYLNSKNPSCNKIVMKNKDLTEPFKLSAIDCFNDGMIDGMDVAVIEVSSEINLFHEVIRQPQANEFNTDSIAVTQQEEAPQYVKLMKGGKFEFTGDKSLEDGNTVAVFNCKYSEKPLPSDFFDGYEEASVISEVEWNGEGLPPFGAECEFSCEGFWGDTDYHWCRFLGLLTDKSYAIEFHHYTSPDRVTCGCFDPQCTSFRKPETPQQRKERERLEVIRQIQIDMNYSGSDYSAAERLYDAGYRKER